MISKLRKRMFAKRYKKHYFVSKTNIIKNEVESRK
jgi:hypothetical protein